MSANFRLKQHLKMSPNAQIKNLVPENLTDVPPLEEWKLGRFWFNTTIGKLQGVFLKLDTDTGEPLDPQEMEIRIVGADALGPTQDGQFWPDGLFDFTEQTKIADAVDDMNEALKDLSPPEATLLKGDLNLIDQHFLSGRISNQSDTSPDALRMANSVAGELVSYIISENDVTATLPTEGVMVKGQLQQQFGKADQGIIVAVINDIPVDEGIDLNALFHENGREYFGVKQGFDHQIMQNAYDVEGNPFSVEVNPNKDGYVSSSGTLIINTVERYNDFKKWQRGAGTVKFSVDPGKHTLHVEHDGIISGQHLNEEIPTDPFKTNTLEVFFDPNNTAPSSVLSNFSIETGNTKFVSGIPYYNTDISFSFNYSATDLFNYTYWDKPISIKMDGSTHDLMDWNDTNSTLNGLSYPTWSDEFQLVSYKLPYNSPNTIVDTVNITARAGKPVTGWGDYDSFDQKILIDTYPISGNSTPLKETFIDEEYRMDINVIDQDDIVSVDANTTGTWNSTATIFSGNAQQFMGTLIKAHSEFSEYNIGTDYTSFADDDQEYYRRFYTIGNKPNSNGTLKITTNGIIGTDFDLFIKLPSLSAWWDASELFDMETFVESFNVDGIGCASQINKTAEGYEISWSAGTLSTADSDFGYLIKVIMKTESCIINEIEEISQNWR